MIPQSFSFYEAHGKHRSPDEIREIERQNQILEAQSYRYGDPVNSAERPVVDSPAVWEKKQYASQRKFNNVFFIFRPFTFFFSLFSSR